MFLTTLLRAKKKSLNVVVMIESVVSGHKLTWLRERTADKLEIVLLDPKVQMPCIYKEIKKLKGTKYIMDSQRRTQPVREFDGSL